MGKGSKVHELKSFDEKLTFQVQSCDPVEKGFKWVLMMGRVIGVSPISVSFKPDGGRLTFRWRSLSTIHCIFLSTVLAIVLATELWSCIDNLGTYPNILEEMGGMEDSIYNVSLLTVYIYLLRNSRKLLNIFHNWARTMATLKLVGRDKGFPRFCLKVAVLLLGTSLVENLFYNVYLIQKEASDLTGDSLIEKIYKVNLGPLSSLVPHWSSITSVPMIYAVWTSNYAANFADIFLIILCRAMSFKFIEINEEIQATVGEMQTVFEQMDRDKILSSSSQQPIHVYYIHPGFSKNSQKLEVVWKEIRDKVLASVGLAEEVTNYVAPLVLVCYMHNIFFVILQGLRLLYEPETGTSPYVYVSIFEFSLRVILVTYFASEVYHSTEAILTTLERYPDSVFSKSAYRLERMLQRHPVNVTLFGTLPITRYIFVSMLTFMFTAEIILLQTMSNAKSRQGLGNDCNCSECIRELLLGLKVVDRI